MYEGVKSALDKISGHIHGLPDQIGEDIASGIGGGYDREMVFVGELLHKRMNDVWHWIAGKTKITVNQLGIDIALNIKDGYNRQLPDTETALIIGTEKIVDGMRVTFMKEDWMGLGKLTMYRVAQGIASGKDQIARSIRDVMRNAFRVARSETDQLLQSISRTIGGGGWTPEHGELLGDRARPAASSAQLTINGDILLPNVSNGQQLVRELQTLMRNS
jgi:hypothetical protein